MSADVAPPSATASTVVDAIDALRELGSSLPLGDGVGSFNSMYLRVTEAVAAALHLGGFTDPGFVDRLDVNFANLYLDAYARFADGRSQEVCASWRALFERRREDGIHPLQFAVAGMNAHINHDLPVAVAVTVREMGITPATVGVRDDYLVVNAILREAYPPVRDALQGSVLDTVDDVLGPIDDVLAMWGIVRAREAAWEKALQLFKLLDDRHRYRRTLDALDRVVALASRCLLSARTDARAARYVLTSAWGAIDGVADRAADVLWGDGVVDGDEDGLLGALLWSAGRVIDDLDDLVDGDRPADDVLWSVLSRLRDLRDAV